MFFPSFTKTRGTTFAQKRTITDCGAQRQATTIKIESGEIVIMPSSMNLRVSEKAYSICNNIAKVCIIFLV